MRCWTAAPLSRGGGKREWASNLVVVVLIVVVVGRGVAVVWETGGDTVRDGLVEIGLVVGCFPAAAAVQTRCAVCPTKDDVQEAAADTVDAAKAEADEEEEGLAGWLLVAVVAPK